MTGFLGEYFGRKNYYLGSMIIFGIASYYCGLSESLWELVFWRFIQGIGGGALLSTSQAILFDADLIHSGSINTKNDNKRVQMKIMHKDDLDNLKEFQVDPEVSNANGIQPAQNRVVNVGFNLSF